MTWLTIIRAFLPHAAIFFAVLFECAGMALGYHFGGTFCLLLAAALFVGGGYGFGRART